MRPVLHQWGRAITSSVLLALATSVQQAGGQQKPVEFITAVPEAPAFTFLSASPSLIERPATIRDFGASLLTGVGADGRVREGFALNASTWNLIPGLAIPLSTYQKRLWAYALANTELSIGTIRVAGDTMDTEAAIGFRVTPFDRTDPMHDPTFTANLGSAILQNCAPATPGSGQSAACVDSITASQFADYTSENWTDLRLSLAVAWGMRFENSALDQREYSGFNAWAVGAVPVIPRRAQLIGQVRYKSHSEVSDVAGYSAVNYGARVLWGSAALNGFAEYVRESRSLEDDVPQVKEIDSDADGWSAGLEFRITENTWLSTGFGSRFTALGDAERTAVFANLRWGVTSKSRIESLR